MPKFKPGDRVVRTEESSHDKMEVGAVYEVEKVGVTKQMTLKGLKGFWDASRFELHKYPNPPHVHADLIKAWADGAEIEVRSDYYADSWATTSEPRWYIDRVYRIKPSEPTAKEKAQAKLDELMKKAEELRKQIEDM